MKIFLPNRSTICFTFIITIVNCFSPDQSSFDAYGLKVAANDVIIVQSIPSPDSFLLHLAPFSYSFTCTIDYNISTQYIYSVAIARLMKANDTIRFVFIGVDERTNVAFIGLLKYTGISGIDYVATLNTTRKSNFSCSGWNKNNYRIHNFDQFVYGGDRTNDNLDNYVVAVEPMGKYAYAFAQNFLVVYNLEMDNVSIQFGNLTWPDSSFLPRAVDINQNLLIIVLGYVGNTSSKFTPCAYLLSRSGTIFTVIDTWMYMPPTNTSWQASLTNWDVDTYSAKYDMSVSFNDVKSQVLLGIQVTNTFLLLNINETSKKFFLSPKSLSNGKSIGMGKSVGWLNSEAAVILVNTYSLNYVWSASQVFTYDVSGNNSFIAKSILPNSQQTLAPEFGPILISIILTRNSTLVMLDSTGVYYILLPSPPGTYADSSVTSISSLQPCIGGSFNSQFDIQPCSLCPPGHSTFGMTGQSSCVSCANDSFCPLGSAFGHILSTSSLLTNVNQARAYPLSPKSVRFDNILLENMFVFGRSSSKNCIVRSPLFWSLIIISVGFLVAIYIIVFKYCINHPGGKRIYERIEHFFKRTDIIGEGEFWMGGIVSFAVIFLCICAYVFSATYYKLYPIEKSVGSAAFTCDSQLTNAQFTSNLMSIMILPNDNELRIFELLDAQSFTLNIDFINTLYACSDVALFQIKDKKLPLSFSSCSDENGSLSIAVPLPSHVINLQFTLTAIKTIGGVRLSLAGPDTEEESEIYETDYKLIELNFAQAFSSVGRVLTAQPSFNIQITKAINRTSPLQEGGTKVLSAFWLPYVSVDVNQIFADESEYIYGTSSNTIISLVISETAFYVLNTQRPIVDDAELIFTDLLFTIICIEIFGLIFVICQLVLLPLFRRIIRCSTGQTALKESSSKSKDSTDMSFYRF